MCRSLFQMTDEPDVERVDSDDEVLALLLAVTWGWHEPLPVAQAA